MSRKFVSFILISSLLIIVPTSRFISHGEALYNFGEISNSAAYLSVPFHYQSKSYYCGPASLEMVFDYYGEDIPQEEIADVARTDPSGTYTDELRRAAHFSNLSTSLGNEIPDNITGYSAREFGYAAFKRQELTIEDLKALIDKGDPTIVLMWWSSLKQYGHYRIVIGYNTTHVITHDPWNKGWGGEYGGANTSMTYETFLDLWDAFDYWGLWIRPWSIELRMPSFVKNGDYFEIVVNITYLCSTPFDTIEYASSNCNATIELQEGLELASEETIQHPLGNILAGDSVQTSWSIHANETGAYNISVTATGIIEGSYPYSYLDAIGGVCIHSFSVVNQTCKVHNVDTGLSFTTIQGAINDLETDDEDTILVDSSVFYEHVVINKSVTLIGEASTSTIIDGDRTGGVITIVADNVNITGFTIKNSGEFQEGLSTYGVLVESNNNDLARNIIIDNSYGIVLSTSNNNTLRENNITNNILNFGIGWNPTLGFFHFLHNIDESNTVNGSPIYYWINQHNKQIPTDAGSVYAINSTNIIVKDIAISHDIVCFAGTNNSRIENVSSDSGVICLTSSQNNTVFNNSMKNSQLSLIYSINNIVASNTISDAELGIYLFGPSYNNTIYHNNLINNTKNAYIHTCNHNSPKNFWDNGFEGNYWSNYTGIASEHDGIGDTPHILDGSNQDNHPLMGMFSSFTDLEHEVNVISNSTIEDLQCFDSNSTIVIHVSNTTTDQTFGFCRICIPHALMNETYQIVINGTEPHYVNYNLADNGTHRWIYFSYQHSTLEIVIIPELPPILILPLLIITTLLTIVTYKRKHPKTTHTKHKNPKKPPLLGSK